MFLLMNICTFVRINPKIHERLRNPIEMQGINFLSYLIKSRTSCAFPVETNHSINFFETVEEANSLVVKSTLSIFVVGSSSLSSSTSFPES
jgi:hypothetical protein